MEVPDVLVVTKADLGKPAHRAMAAVLPAPVLLIADLGRPGRFLNMLRIFKPRSPMNVGAWCLTAFSGAGAGAVAADLVGAPRTGRALGAAQALLGSYLGSYTGVLLATTAVMLAARKDSASTARAHLHLHGDRHRRRRHALDPGRCRPGRGSPDPRRALAH